VLHGAKKLKLVRSLAPTRRSENLAAENSIGFQMHIE